MAHVRRSYSASAKASRDISGLATADLLCLAHHFVEQLGSLFFPSRDLLFHVYVILWPVVAQVLRIGQK